MRIPFAKNAYIEPREESNRYGHVSENGVGGWTDADSLIKVYFWANSRGTLNIALNAKSPESTSSLQISHGDRKSTIDVRRSDEYADIPVGPISIKKTGIQIVKVKAVRKSGAYYPNLRELVVSGPAARGVRYNTIPYRNAPSTHLWYETPKGADLDAFYSELTIPEGADPLHSYYVANGFSGGYFGIQVNSETKRTVLWGFWDLSGRKILEGSGRNWLGNG